MSFLVDTGSQGVGSRLFLVAVAMQRVRQLQAGARPRLDPLAHKHAHVALAEASAGLVSWQILAEAVPVGGPRLA